MINAILLKSDYTMEIMPQLVAYICQTVLVLCHHLYVLQSGYKDGWEAWVTFFAVVMILQQVVHEATQLFSDGKRYFTQVFNYL